MSIVDSVLPLAQYNAITDQRVSDPTGVLWTARDRPRREVLAPDGRLLILAADHPARRVTAAGEDPLAMADRRGLLARILRVLRGGAADGVMASMDVLEDLLILHKLEKESGGTGFLDQTVLIASMNRGGLSGCVWEMDDPVTGPNAEGIARMGLDGGKLLLRLCPDDAGSLRTLEQCAHAIHRLNAKGLAGFLEPLAIDRSETGFTMSRDPIALAKAVSVGAALGDSSHNLWLKLPWCPDFRAVAAATTLPILLLGGGDAATLPSLSEQLSDAMNAGANVRGLMVGRALLFGAGDPLEIAQPLYAQVHGS